MIIATRFLKLIAFFTPLLFIAAQCQTIAPPPTATPLPTPTPMLFTPPQPGDGTDLIDRLLEKGVIRVGIRVWPEAEFAPPAFRGASNAAIGGALTGFEVDIARHIADGLGLELELVEAYPPVITSGEWQGEWDIAMASLVPFDQPLPGVLTQQVAYSAPYGYIPMGVLAANTVGNIESFEQLSGRRVGVFEHSAYQRLLTPEEGALTVQGQPVISSTPNVRLIVLSNLQKSIRELDQPTQGEDAPQVDVIFGPAPVLREAMHSGLPVKMALEGDAIGVQPLAVAAVPQDGLKVDRLLTEINTIFNRLDRQGTLSEIYLEWYNQDYSQSK
jgi:ABC-type amino acid transport substrate-binding protein